MNNVFGPYDNDSLITTNKYFCVQNVQFVCIPDFSLSFVLTVISRETVISRDEKLDSFGRYPVNRCCVEIHFTSSNKKLFY